MYSYIKAMQLRVKFLKQGIWENMMNVNKIEAVTERDIDLLLLEELNVSNDFSLWFYSVITNSNDGPLCKGAWHSISDATLGESDLVVIYENGIAVLIENKIDALAQPEQGVRYKARGEKGVKAGLWDSFVTCMVAPSLYLQKENDANIYDVNLSYEKIANWFSSQNTFESRAKYKSYLIKEAIEQNRRGYTVIPDTKATEFWAKYWVLSSQQYPELEMKKPGIKPANSDWPDFRPSILNNRFSIVHKLGRGDVDLQIAGMADKLEYLKNLLADLEIEVVKAGKSAAVRIKVGSINKFSSFESQKNTAIEGLDAARRLLHNRVRSRIAA
jgi:hypothetical protein